MRSHAILLLVTLLVAVSTGCVDGAGIFDQSGSEIPPNIERDSTASIQTDRTYYRLREDWVGLATEIAIHYENQTDDTLYIVNCNRLLGPVLEKRVGGEWVRFWWPILPRCLSPPIVIAPGDVLVGKLQVWGAPPDGDVWPKFQSDDVEGVYRLLLSRVVFNYHDYEAGSFGDPVPLRDRLSNLFYLDDPRR